MMNGKWIKLKKKPGVHSLMYAFKLFSEVVGERGKSLNLLKTNRVYKRAYKFYINRHIVPNSNYYYYYYYYY